MRRLQSTLQGVLPDLTSLGGDNASVNRERLMEVLGHLISDLGRTLALRTAVSLVLVSALSYLAWHVPLQPIHGLVAAAGILVVSTAAILALRQVSDELARAQMLLSISPRLSREALTDVARWLATAV